MAAITSFPFEIEGSGAQGFECPGLGIGLFFVVEVGRRGLLVRIGEVRAAYRFGQRIVKADCRSGFGDRVDFRLCIRHGCHLLSVVIFLGRECLLPRKVDGHRCHPPRYCRNVMVRRRDRASSIQGPAS